MKKLEIDKGMSLWNAVAYAKERANIYTGTGEVEIVFNDIKLVVSCNSSEQDIAEIYRLKRKCGEYISE